MEAADAAFDDGAWFGGLRTNVYSHSGTPRLTLS